MELRQLQCLIACAQTQSFSKAALLLFTTQSNVSKTIASLEKELGRKLFERKQYGIVLTEKGRQVYKHALSMMECSAKIMDCVESEEMEELRISFQPSSWFASAFCDYYILSESEDIRFRVTGAPVDEIIRRISNDLDDLGFACMDDSQLEKCKEMFQTNHIGYYALKRMNTVLYYGGDTDFEDLTELSLIQGSEDYTAGISSFKKKDTDDESNLKLRVKVTTNSDYIMQEMLERTSLGNIRPEYAGLSDEGTGMDRRRLEESGQTVQFVCLFRNDRVLEKQPKKFLAFIRRKV